MFGLEELDFKLDLSGRPFASRRRGVEDVRCTGVGRVG